MSFSIGCDPEFFLLKKGKPHSAIGLVGGTKEEPKPLRKQGFSIQEDNVAVEFNIPPAYSHEEFIESIAYVMENLKKRLKGFTPSEDSALEFEQEQLLHPKALEFGCEPDFNAWTKQMNPRPIAENHLLRSAGGHVHVGTKEDPIEVIRAMDLFLGVPSIKIDSKGQRRRPQCPRSDQGACAGRRPRCARSHVPATGGRTERGPHPAYWQTTRAVAPATRKGARAGRRPHARSAQHQGHQEQQAWRTTS